MWRYKAARLLLLLLFIFNFDIHIRFSRDITKRSVELTFRNTSGSSNELMMLHTWGKHVNSDLALEQRDWSWIAALDGGIRHVRMQR